MFILLEKTMQGRNDTAAQRALKRIVPKSLELALLLQEVAAAFCGKLVDTDLALGELRVLVFSVVFCRLISDEYPDSGILFDQLFQLFRAERALFTN